MNSTEENKRVVKRWLEEGWNKRDAEVFFAALADDFVNHCTGRDLERMRTDLHAQFEKTHPTSRVVIDELIAEDCRVALRTTHLEDGKEPRLELVVCHLRDGKITDVWNCFGSTTPSESRRS